MPYKNAEDATSIDEPQAVLGEVKASLGETGQQRSS